MKELDIFVFKQKAVVDSRDIAEVVGKAAPAVIAKRSNHDRAHEALQRSIPKWIQ